jgi:hypothetical protein
MTATRTSPNGQTHVEPLPLFLVTLTRIIKFQEIFKLNSLNDILIKGQLYRGQTGPTQCYNCQNFDQIWANCKQPPRCLWCGGVQLRKESPEKANTEPTPSCCNCTLVRRRETSSSVISRLPPCERRTAKEENTTSSQGILWEEVLCSPHYSSPKHLHCFKTRNISNRRHSKQMGKVCGTP